MDIKNRKIKILKSIKILSVIFLGIFYENSSALIRNFLIQTFHIPSGSMIPTLLIGDNLFVAKNAYGYSRYSMPSGGIVNYFSGRIWSKKPKLGEVVVFRPIGDPSTHFVSRIVGVPGDHIQVKNGILYINALPCLLEPDGEVKTIDDNGKVLKASKYIEMLPNGIKHPIIKQVAFGEGKYDNTPIYHVPEDHYFMMRDNRDYSNDSRVQGIMGYIPFENLVGRVSLIYFSTGGNILLWEFWKWLFTADYSRFFKNIQ